MFLDFIIEKFDLLLLTATVLLILYYVMEMGND